MRKALFPLVCAASFLMLLPDGEAANIPDGTTLVVPPDPGASVFTTPAPLGGGTLVINAGGLMTGALTTSGGALIGHLVLNSGSQLNGAVGNPGILDITLNGNALIQGATGAQTFNLGQNTLSIVGALNLQSGAIINTRVVTNALFGNVNIGAATDSIAGASVTVNVDASGVVALTPGAPLFVVNAGAGTSGLPVNVTSNNVLYSFIGNNLNGNITIIPTLNPAVVPPGGVGSVFTALVTIAANNPGSDIATVVAALAALPTAAALQSALLQFNPNVDGVVPLGSFEAAKQFQNLWSKHMGYGRCVYATGCDDICYDDNAQLSASQQEACNKKEEADCSAINCQNVENRYEIWADRFGYFGHQGSRKGFHSFDLNIYGGMVGFQVPLNREVSVGLGTGYAHTSVDRSSGQAHDGTIQTYDATGYVSYNPTHWYIDGALSVDYNRYHDSRSIQFPGIDRTASARYSGQQYTGLVAAGYRYYSKHCFIITPLASVQYSFLHVNDYHEHGAGDLDLQVDDQNYNFLESSVGFKLARPIQTSKGAIVPEIHALWLHDFFGDEMDLNTSFSGVAAQSGPFATTGPQLPRNRGDVGAGITFISCNRLAIQLVYNYEFSSSYHANEALAKLSYRF